MSKETCGNKHETELHSVCLQHRTNILIILLLQWTTDVLGPYNFKRLSGTELTAVDKTFFSTSDVHTIFIPHPSSKTGMRRAAHGWVHCYCHNLCSCRSHADPDALFWVSGRKGLGVSRHWATLLRWTNQEEKSQGRLRHCKVMKTNICVLLCKTMTDFCLSWFEAPQSLNTSSWPSEQG